MVEKMIKTYRGLLADGGQDRIRLSTIKGKIGYRVIKFQIMSKDLPGTSAESVVTIWKSEQSGTMPLVIDFTDSDLLGAAYFSGSSSPSYTQDTIIIFDQEIFNQDIYVAHNDSQDASAQNYYLELEVIPLDDAGAEYTTLKDMRQA
jgi:hypothetical protein